MCPVTTTPRTRRAACRIEPLRGRSDFIGTELFTPLRHPPRDGVSSCAAGIHTRRTMQRKIIRLLRVLRTDAHMMVLVDQFPVARRAVQRRSIMSKNGG